MMIRFILLIACANWALAATKAAVVTDYDKSLHPAFLGSKAADPSEANSDFWNKKAQDSIQEKIAGKLNQNVAKNIIIFLGDGMSIPTVAASRVYIGGEEAQLAFDKFPYTGLSKTYAVNKQVADSACTSTAYLCGVKANYGTLGVNAHVPQGDCDAMQDPANHVLSIAHKAQQANKKSGIVTTTRVTNASPAGAYSHTAHRDWECDTDVKNAGQDPTKCIDIASQLVNGDTGKNMDVIIGGGRDKFRPNTFTDEQGGKGARSDGVNLIDQWLEMKGENAAFVWNKEQLLALPETTESLMGLVCFGTCDYNLDRDTAIQPSLEEKTEAAIKILSKGENGFFLFVEGGRIDTAHHENRARKSLDETAEFSKAIQKAVDLTDEQDTLIVVTSDHAHTFTYNGYGTRGQDIFGFGGTGRDGLVYTSVSYANGNGYRTGPDGGRPDYTQDSDLASKDYVFPATVPLGSETHGGDDVGIFARGPWAHLFSGVNEQNVIPHLMAFAACVGDDDTACKWKERTGGGALGSFPLNSFVVVSVSLFVMLINLMM